MSQATTEPTTPTTGDVLARVGETLAALQDAEQTCVEAARKLYEHTQDGNAHGAGLQENIGREMPRPVWQGTALAFQKADGTTVAEAVDLKGRKGDRGEAGPRPEHRWDGTFLTVQSADGSWPENGVDLKGEKGDRGDIGPRPEHRWDGTRLTVQNADGSWPESGVDLKGEKGDAGEVNLADAVDSDSSTTAASSLAVKTAYDAATAAQSAADAAQATATAAGETADAAKQAAATLAGRFDGSGKVLPAHLPVATTAALGAVSIGGGLSVTAQGVLSATCLIQSRRNGLPVYVRQNGSDSNDGLTEATAVASIARAQAILHTLDFGNTSAQINVGEGTFDITNLLFTQIPLCQSFAILTGAGNGKTILTAGTSTVTSQGRIEPSANWQFRNLTLRATSASRPVLNVNNGNLVLNNVAVEAAVASTATLMGAANGGVLALTNSTSFRGTVGQFVGADTGSIVYVDQGTTTFNGTVTTSTIFAVRSGVFLISAGGSVSGQVTGKRYRIAQNGVIFTNGGGPNTFPGTEAGEAITGGVYV